MYSTSTPSFGFSVTFEVKRSRNTLKAMTRSAQKTSPSRLVIRDRLAPGQELGIALDLGDEVVELLWRVGQVALLGMCRHCTAELALIQAAARAALRASRSRREIIARMVGRAGERRRRDQQEALGARRALDAARTRRAARSASTGWWRGVGCRYWPMVRKSTSAERRSSITWRTSRFSSPRPTMMPDLVKICGSQLLDLLRAGAASGSSAHRAARCGRAAARSRGCGCRRRAAASTIFSTAPGLRRKSGVRISIVVVGRGLADRFDAADELEGAAVGQVVAIDRGDHDMARGPMVDDRLGQVLGLLRSRRPRAARS